MEQQYIKRSLNHVVKVTTRDFESKMLFTGCILRVINGDYKYFAECQDLKQNKSIMIIPLEKIELEE